MEVSSHFKVSQKTMRDSNIERAYTSASVAENHILSAKAKHNAPMTEAMMLPGCIAEKRLSIRTSIQNRNITLSPMESGEMKLMQRVT